MSGVKVGIVRADGKFYAFRNRCPHDGGRSVRAPSCGNSGASTSAPVSALSTGSPTRRSSPAPVTAGVRPRDGNERRRRADRPAVVRGDR
ncbi:hypothetical protein [Natrinema gelatinilyticum]|uniref:hypothetical protein n=1 Tax=Natrinema gelatinilyticum TaxID=2961571 RepID=UPI0020C1EE60|nr:hypothetical protein [Natrinema gelatinilyticum]